VVDFFSYLRRKASEVSDPFFKKPFVRVNLNIRASEVRLIDGEGKMVGIKPFSDAMKLAENASLDLIEISPNAKPPVCKLGNLSKFLYEKEKKSKEARKHNTAGQVKEVRFRIKIGIHDFNVKVNHILRFLKGHHKVRVSMVMFGRELRHKDLAQEMMNRVEEQIKGAGIIEQRAQMYGNRLISILVPHRG